MRLICVKKPESHNQKACDLAAVILSGVAILLVFIAIVAATTAVVRSLCTAEDAVDEEVQGELAKFKGCGCENIS